METDDYKDEHFAIQIGFILTIPNTPASTPTASISSSFFSQLVRPRTRLDP
jgi:hypothetical protein